MATMLPGRLTEWGTVMLPALPSGGTPVMIGADRIGDSQHGAFGLVRNPAQDGPPLHRCRKLRPVPLEFCNPERIALNCGRDLQERPDRVGPARHLNRPLGRQNLCRNCHRRDYTMPPLVVSNGAGHRIWWFWGNSRCRAAEGGKPPAWGVSLDGACLSRPDRWPWGSARMAEMRRASDTQSEGCHS